jgi:flagellar hook assembly protein FlgD
MDDMNFIAQLAQFSSLEKLTEIADGVKALGDQMRGSQTLSGQATSGNITGGTL